MSKPLLVVTALALLAGCSPSPTPSAAQGEAPGTAETGDAPAPVAADGDTAQLFEVADDRVQLNAGMLEVTGLMGEQALLFDARTIRPKAFLHELVRGVDMGQRQAVLVAEISGGVACPAQYFFVEVDAQGQAMVSPDFGTCSDVPQLRTEGAAVVVSMPAAEGEKAWRYVGGKLTAL